MELALGFLGCVMGLSIDGGAQGVNVAKSVVMTHPLGNEIVEVVLAEHDEPGLFTVSRTEVANPCRSCANRFVLTHALRLVAGCDLRPKFRRSNGLLDTAYRCRE